MERWPAREILPKVTGQSLGNAPEPWAEWHAKTYGPPTVDLAAGVYELAQIIRLEMRNGTEIYRLEGKIYGTYSALLARLRTDAETARGLGRKFGVVMQVPEDGFPLERLTRLAEAVSGLPPYNLVVSPVSDEFVPFSVALQNLQRFLKPSRRSP